MEEVLASLFFCSVPGMGVFFFSRKGGKSFGASFIIRRKLYIYIIYIYIYICVCARARAAAEEK
jgi:hypothetical protein